jgi:hypothetical protein
MIRVMSMMNKPSSIWCFFGKEVCFFKNEILIVDGLEGLEAISSKVFGRFPLLAQKRRTEYNFMLIKLFVISNS